jgi:osmotically-inducible protein OsmY
MARASHHRDATMKHAETWIDKQARGLVRPDLHIQDDVLEKLATHPETSRIEVSAELGIVTLTGHVTSPRARILADALASDVDGVMEVDNRVRVVRA